MFGFGKNKNKHKEALGIEDHNVMKIGVYTPSPATDDMLKAMKAATDKIASETPREVIAAPDKFSVEYHVENITSILASLKTRRASLVETMRLDREDFERREADNTAKVAELDRLAATYEGALKIAAPGGNDGYGAVDPARLTETGKRIAKTRRRPARPGRRETIEVPPGFKAVRDAEGKATGEIEPVTNILNATGLSNEQKAKLKGIPN